MPDTPLEEMIELGYVVREEPGRPSLEEQVGSRGPLAGPELQRLAIATMTGLAALHRAGVLHGAVRPDTVLLGPNGPRLRHPEPKPTGPALDEETVDAGTLTWSTPEELKGLPADRPADVFAWAATIAFAATGHSPFGDGGSATARVNRLLHGAADLGPLEGALRDLVADCLAAEPAERPTAEDALLRLIGYSGVLDSALPSVREEARERSTRPVTRRAPVLVVAAVVIALISGGVTYLVTADRPGTRPVSGPATTTSAPSRTPASAPPRTAREIALPGGGTLHERPDDPVKLASFRAGERDKRSAAYARVPGSDRFERVGGPNVGAEVSPDGRWLAVVNELYVTVSDRQEVVFTDRRTGTRFALPVAAAPDIAQTPNWSRDSRKLVLTVTRTDFASDIAVTRGFVMLDVQARTSTFVPTSEPEQSKENPISPSYHWTPDGNGVAAYYTTPISTMGLRFRDLTGRVTGTMHWVGHVVGEQWYSPSGRLFVTTACPRSPTCVWETATGRRRASISGPGQEYAIGWYDESHLIRGTWSGKDVFRVVVVDFAGKEVRLLAEVKSAGRWLPTLTFVKG